MHGRCIQGLCGVLFEAHCALKVKLRRHTVRSVQSWGWSARSKTSSSPCRRCSSANPSIESSNIQYEIRNVPGDLAEELSDLLLADGALSATIIEHRRPGANEEEIFKEKFGSSEFWKTCSVQVCYLLSEEEEQNAQHTTLMRTALTWTGADETVLGAIDISQGEEIKPMNWQQAILDEYQEIQIAENLKIVPTWGEADDNPATNPATPSPTHAPSIIRLNPGIAFGTGDHPTTRMCLQWINTLRDANVTSLLDYGAGSGILAIAALILNVSKSAIGTDIEPLAIKASAHNATINGVGDRFTAQLIDEAQETHDANAAEQTHDIIVANILQGPLTQLAPRLAAHAHRGTRLGLSGITSNQAEGIQKAYEAVGFRHFVTQTDDTAVTPLGHRWVVLTAVFAGDGSDDAEEGHDGRHEEGHDGRHDGGHVSSR